VVLHEFVEFPVEPVVDRTRGRVDEVVGRAAQLDVELPDEAGVDEFVLAGRPLLAADEKLRHRLQRLDRRRAPDTGRRPVGHRLEAFQRDCEVCAALVLGEAVNLVDDDVLDGPQLLLELRGVEQDCERLGRRVENVGRLVEHPLALAVVGVAVPDRMTDVDRLAVGCELLRDPLEWHLEVPVDVVCQRLERGDVQAVDAVFEATRPLAPEEFVDDAQESREGLPAARRRADQRVRPLVDERDRLLLWGCEEPAVLRDELAELREPPLLDGRFQQLEDGRVVDGHRPGIEGQVTVGEPVAPSHLSYQDVGANPLVGSGTRRR